MSIKLAQEFEFNIVKKITHETINEIYPHYYSNGAVVFFIMAQLSRQKFDVFIMN